MWEAVHPESNSERLWISWAASAQRCPSCAQGACLLSTKVLNLKGMEGLNQGSVCSEDDPVEASVLDCPRPCAVLRLLCPVLCARTLLVLSPATLFGVRSCLVSRSVRFSVPHAAHGAMARPLLMPSDPIIDITESTVPADKSSRAGFAKCSHAERIGVCLLQFLLVLAMQSS